MTVRPIAEMAKEPSPKSAAEPIIRDDIFTMESFQMAWMAREQFPGQPDRSTGGMFVAACHMAKAICCLPMAEPIPVSLTLESCTARVSCTGQMVAFTAANSSTTSLPARVITPQLVAIDSRGILLMDNPMVATPLA